MYLKEYSPLCLRWRSLSEDVDFTALHSTSVLQLEEAGHCSEKNGIEFLHAKCPQYSDGR